MKLIRVLAVLLVINLYPTPTSALLNPCTDELCDLSLCKRCSGDGQCILESFFCDGQDDCNDGSDELDCGPSREDYRTCVSGEEFTCLNKQCIRSEWECNGVTDCDDSSDEAPINHCKKKNQCRSNEFVCDDGLKCFSERHRCNFVNDCRDGSDEYNCDAPKCLDSEFTCTISRACIPQYRRCDGEYDCGAGDHSDEDCTDPPKCRDKSEFTCGTYPLNYKCISATLRCDGSRDCDDNSDEEDCSPELKLCGDNRTLCDKSTTCIANNAWCDGKLDCPGGEDEEDCNCDTSKEVECDNKDCISASKFCNGVPDCLDGSDEKAQCCPIGRERRTPDAPTCEDIDECKTRDGACSQYCHNTNGSFTCSCASGYSLTERPKQRDRSDQHTYCKASGPSLKLLVSIEKEIRVLEDKAGDFTVIQMDDKGYKAADNTISDFDYDFREQKVFWCSRHVGDRDQMMTMWSADFSGNSLTSPKVILENIDCGSIAVDWVNHLVYWTVFSADTMVIEVVKYDGSDRRSLIWEGLSKPRMIDVVPEDGLLFWTDWGDDPHIGRANMDGSDRRILVQQSRRDEIRWPNALTVDLPTKHIYWMDAHHQSIEIMDFNGENRYTVSKSFKGLGHPWRMRVFEDRLFWTDWSLEGRLSSLNKFNGNDMKTISTDLKVYMLSLRIYHPLSQPMVPNRCAGAKCTHLCLLVPNGYKCGCPTGHKLLYDGLTCANEIGSYAFIAMEGRIVKMALNPMEPTPQPIRFGSSPESQFNSLDYYNGWLYFNNISSVDGASVTIDRMRYDGSDAKVLVEKKAKGGVAVDYINEKLYWANEETVGVGELDGSVHTTIIQREGYDFRDILLAPCQGLMYLAVWGPGKGIFRAFTDGSNFQQIIWLNDTRDCNPSGLTLDKDSNSLFFTNDKSLYRVDLNQERLEPTIIYNSSNSLVIRLYGAAIWGTNIIWTEWWDKKGEHTQGSAIMYMGKLGVANGTLPQPIRYNLTQMPMSIKVHPREGAECKNPDNPCIDHDCSHLCLQRPRSEAKKYTCVCPTGYALKEGSDRVCAEDILQYLVFNAEKGIQTISLDTSFLTPMKESYSLNNEVTSFDLECASNTVYLCYNNNMFSSRKLFDKKDPTPLDIHALNCSGMAIEWVTGKLFLADKGSSELESDGRILVIDLKRPSLMSHIKMGLPKPYDIAVHPRRGMIYWITETYNIMSTSMDASIGVETVVATNLKTNTLSETITQLYIDYNTDYIYWTEEQVIDGVKWSYIKKVHIDTRTPETVVQSSLITIYGVAIMGDDLYYTDSGGMLYKKTGPGNGEVILKTKRHPKNILFLKSSMSQYSMDNPCEIDNGGCSDLCLIDTKGSSLCSCPTGIQLKDKLNCDTPFNKTLLVANLTRINMLPIASNKDTLDTVLTSQPKNLRSIDVDIMRNIVYWSEIPEGNKESAVIWQLDMATRKTEKVVSADIKQPNSIAVDWNAQNLYWLDAGDEGKGTLEVISLRNKKRAVIHQYEAGSNNRPNQIVVDPKEKYIFVSYSVPSQEVIVKMWLDGSNKFSIPKKVEGVDKGKTFILTDLAIDIKYKRLYWATSGQSNQIQTCDYDGADFKTLRSEPGTDSLIQAMGVLNGNVFLQKQMEDNGMEVRYFREGEANDAGTFPLEQIQGMIVSINVLSTDVLNGYSDMSCRRKECEDMICIPNHINVTCKCSTGDKECEKSFEKKTYITTNVLPFQPAKTACTPDYCNDKGTCYVVTNITTPFCECLDGYDKPRCSKGRHMWTIVIIVSALIVLVILVVFACRSSCCSNARDGYGKALSNESIGESELQSRDPRQQILIQIQDEASNKLVQNVAPSDMECTEF